MRVSVLVPVHNERQTLKTIVERVVTVAKPHEVIIVDDGSTDGSRQVAEALRKTYSTTVRVIAHTRNRGKGAAIISGGGCCMAGTPLQDKLGIKDSPDLAFDELDRYLCHP